MYRLSSGLMYFHSYKLAFVSFLSPLCRNKIWALFAQCPVYTEAPVCIHVSIYMLNNACSFSKWPQKAYRSRLCWLYTWIAKAIEPARIVNWSKISYNNSQNRKRNNCELYHQGVSSEINANIHCPRGVCR